MISEKTEIMLLKWIHNNFPEIGNIESKEFNTLNKRIGICIQCIKAYLNRDCDCKFNINSRFTKILYAKIHTNLDINFIDNSRPDMRIYLLKLILISRGYDCDLNGIYNNYTRRAFKKYCMDNNIDNGKYPYSVNSHVWYKLLTIEEKENN